MLILVSREFHQIKELALNGFEVFRCKIILQIAKGTTAKGAGGFDTTFETNFSHFPAPIV